MQNLRLPSFFPTKTTLEEKGIFEGLIASASNISFRCCRTSSNMSGGILLYGSLNGVLSVNLMLCLTISAFPRSVGPLENIWDQLSKTCLTYNNCSVDKVSASIETSNASRGISLEVSDSFFEGSGVHVSTTETLIKEHSNDLGGISITRADRLHILTETLTLFPADVKETTLGQIAKSPDKEVSTCCVRAV